ncbi:MAG TPA: molybdopterin cofactor-binding domain-containing protein, partial [Kofleriaceae bacterium]|nr:molybdopterin cofactor-binding domain-containing protein [Kofleriaceae bacterium]
MTAQGIGASVLRKEDRRFLLGKGQYTDDLVLPDQTYAVFVRSPHAHAGIAKIDGAAARAVPGVLAVLTGEDVAADGLGGIPCGWLVKSKDGSNMVEPPHPALAQGTVRHVGDPVVMVVATSKAAAKAAAALVDVEYDVRQGVGLLADAIADGAPQVWPEAKGNVCFDWHLGELGPVDAAFAGAARIVELDLVNNRVAPNAMEPRAAIGHYEPATGNYTLYTTSQNPHLI